LRLEKRLEPVAHARVRWLLVDKPGNRCGRTATDLPGEDTWTGGALPGRGAPADSTSGCRRFGVFEVRLFLRLG